MNNIVDLLQEVTRREISLSADDDELVVHAKKSVLDSLILARLREYKQELIDVLRAKEREELSSSSLLGGGLPLVELSEEEIARIVTGVPGGAGNVQDIYPLAPLQEGILFHHLMGGEGDPYLLANEIGFEDRSKMDDFLSALQAVIQRHDILRTAIWFEGLQEPVQVVWRHAVLPIEEVEIEASAESAAEQLYARFDPRRHRIDIRQAPLFRVYVTKDRSTNGWLMMLLHHHLVGDHTTVEEILKEVRAHLLGQADRLPAPLPFRNLVAQTRLGISREEHERFFKQLLGDVEEPTAPFGLLEVRGDGSGIDEAHLEVEANLARRLRKRARELEVSAASLCHLAWAQVLAKVTGRQDVVFGTVLFGRMQGGEGSDHVMGPFINTLPIRIRIGEQGAESGVRQTHELLADLLWHEHASLALAQRCSGVPAPIPLFTALLNYRHSLGELREPEPADQRAWNGMRVMAGQERTNYPFTLSVDDLGEGLELTAQVDGSINAMRICEFMHTALESLVTALETSPATPLHRLALLAASERHQVLYEWNATEAAYPSEKCVHQLFEEQVEKSPEAVAVEFEEESLSYAELNRRANQVAHYLRAHGVKPDSRVAICVERSLELVIGLLGILKAGGAYVPLDPAYPEERLHFMVEDSEPVALLTQSHLIGLFGGLEAKVLELDDAAAPWLHEAESNPDPVEIGLSSHHLAYIIYTSGSTGTPKGVMVEHRQILPRLSGIQESLSFCEKDMMPNVSSIAFDISLLELLLPLVSGGRTVLTDAAGIKDLGYLVERTRSATVFNAVTSLMDVWHQHLLGEDVGVLYPQLRALLVGGEPVSQRLLDELSTQFPGVEIVETYGPTESALYCTSCSRYAGGGGASSPPIGRPLANTRMYILDGHGEPVPVGVAGELYIGGAGVARGYLSRAELTAERFLKDPFADEPGARMYRTGDLGRWLPDGNIEFLGRNDYQVKIRGFRIELGEIEARLLEHSEVKEAVVLAREDAPGEKRLVAYYTVADTNSRDGEALSAEHMRTHLSGLLPEYMVPAAYVRLDSMPLTPNGKLDRRGLPAPEQSAYSVSSYEAPQGETEVLLAEIWADLLKLDRVGRHDNFFSLGGHSLLAVRAVTRVRQLMGAEVAIRDLFARPVLADLARTIENSPRAELSPITYAEREGELPLSFAQQRLWFLAQMEGAGQAYHLPLSLRLKGYLGRGALRQALDRILFRHEALRTTFVSIEGEPVQRISAAEDSRFLLLEHDFCGSSQAPQELERLLALEASGAFDLKRGPLIRGRLIRLSEDEHVLLVTVHHIVSDGWSMEILANELSALYGSFLRGAADPLPALEIQYADYAVWQRQWVEGDALRRQTEYWRAALEGAPTVVELPTDHARPAQQDFKGATTELVLDEKLTAGLKILSKRHGTTLYMTLLAAWAALLARLSGQSDVVIGTPVANRSRVEIEGLIGFFVNTLAIRLDLSGSPSVGELLRRTRTQTLGAQQHQDIPFEQVVELLQPERSLAHSPIFQVMFTWQNNKQGVLELPGLNLQLLDCSPQTMVKFDLEVSLQEAATTVTGGIEYATSLFERETIDRWLGYFRNLVEGMVADDTQVVDQLPILSASERSQVLYEWNATETAYPSEKCVHQLFEEQVEKSPQAVAVEFEEESLSYAELNRRANQVAHYLRGQGVKPDSRVAICVERGLELVIGLLGILKAGGAYVPLDPAYPEERLRFMVEDSEPVVLLTQNHLIGLFGGLDGEVPVLELDDAAAPWLHEAESNPDPAEIGLSSHHLVYVIYTSGSTGKPKGVAMANKCLVNLLCWQVARANFCVSQKMLQFAAFGFDVATQEIFSTICSGATLIFIDEEKRFNPSEFISCVVEKHIDRVILPYAALQMLAEGLESIKQRLGEQAYEKFPLKEVIVAGEQLRIDPKIAAFFRYFKASRLENQYGPTETHCVCAFKLPCDVDQWPILPPIGRPLANTHIYILDGHGEPVPAGVVGEIYIGGVGVARGYLNRPELTAERFLRDPFADEPGARMYRTGDLGRWLPDRNIEFLGRNDYQVKIRGFRIELGEIETRLLEHNGTTGAVVLAREDTPGEKRLVAYYTVADTDSAGGEVPGAEQLRTHLLGLLPEYMVPAAYVRLESLPLTPNGKLDRRGLPAPEQSAYSVSSYEAPVGETEILLAEIWAELLHLDRVGRHDNFFSLGGHSLLAVTLIERMRRSGFEVDVRAVFATPTVAQMAAPMDARAAVKVPPNLISPNSETITPQMLPLVQLSQEEIARVVGRVPGGVSNVQDIYPLAPLQEGMLFHHLIGGDGDPYLLASVMGFEDRSKLDDFLSALQAVIQRHDILRTAICWEGLPEPVQVVWRHAVLPIEEVEIEASAESAAEQLYARFDPRRHRIDIRQAPLFRVYVTKDRSTNGWLMMLLHHHLVGDHTTLEVMQAEVRALLLGQTDRLPAPLPFRNLVAQTRLGISREEHERFFKQLLGDVEEPSAPFGLLDIQGDGSDIEATRLPLDDDLNRSLRHHARRLGVNAASLCHLAWAQVLAKVTGRQDVVFGTVLFGRMQGGQGSDQVMGLFMNTLPVRILIGEEGVENAVRHTHTLLAELMRHEHAPLSLAQRCSAVPPPAPLFSALLNYRHTPDAETHSDEALQAWKGISRVRGEERTNYPFMLSINDHGIGFSLVAQTPSRLRPMRICEFMRTALDSLVQALEDVPAMPVRALEVLPASERAQVLYGWNSTETEYPSERCVHQVFEEQVEKSPQAIAVEFEEESLSYTQLNRRANQLAHYLRELGVGPDQRVAICVERSLEMMVALLAVLKAGGAYVPLDPTYPVERLYFMLRDSAPVALLTQHHLSGLFSSVDTLVPLLELDAAPSPWLNQPETNFDPDNIGLTPRHLAYIIYTSGSTGQPKGVLIEHLGLVNRLIWMQRAYELNSRDAVLQKTPFGFDVSVWELFLPLLVGARLVVARPEGHKDPAYLCEVIQQHQVTTTHFVPSMLQAFLEHEDVVKLSTLVRVVCSGEALSATQLRRFQQRLPHAGLHNLYGPTEAVVDVTAWSCPDIFEDKSSIVPIGRPIANVRVYILDSYGQPVPEGVVGELFIAGVQVARGYLNRAELTAERFLKDPFADEPGARMYRTGDLGRWLPDGNIEFLGRNDYQVKIRGFRIELGEIEARLLEYGGVKEAVVLAREDAPGEKRLVAYYTVADTNSRDGEALNAEHMRTHLSGLLPEYMVPAAYVRLESLPLTPNGKLDRKALPTPDGDAYGTGAYEPPVGEAENLLAKIWADLLKLDRVGRHDNFFSLGGHSLLAVQVVTRVRQSIGVEMAIRDLFSMPGLADLARTIENSPRAELSPIPRIERARRLPPSAMPRPITATREDGLRIVSHDKGATWRDLQSGELVK